MAIEYFCCYHSYLKKCEKLTDQELGRLFRALLLYSMTGERTELAGRESIAFDFIAEDIDKAKVNYVEKCRKNTENGKRGGRPRKQEKSDGLSENRTVFEETQKSQGQRSKVKREDDSLRSSSCARAREGDDDQREKKILAICGDAVGGIDAAERDMLLSACAGLDVEEIRKAVDVAKGYGARTAKYLAQSIQTQREKPGRKPMKPKEAAVPAGKILQGGLRPAPKIPG